MTTPARISDMPAKFPDSQLDEIIKDLNPQIYHDKFGPILGPIIRKIEAALQMIDNFFIDHKWESKQQRSFKKIDAQLRQLTHDFDIAKLRLTDIYKNHPNVKEDFKDFNAYLLNQLKTIDFICRNFLEKKPDKVNQKELKDFEKDVQSLIEKSQLEKINFIEEEISQKRTKEAEAAKQKLPQEIPVAEETSGQVISGTRFPVSKAPEHKIEDEKKQLLSKEFEFILKDIKKLEPKGLINIKKRHEWNKEFTNLKKMVKDLSDTKSIDDVKSKILAFYGEKPPAQLFRWVDNILSGEAADKITMLENLQVELTQLKNDALGYKEQVSKDLIMRLTWKDTVNRLDKEIALLGDPKINFTEELEKAKRSIRALYDLAEEKIPENLFQNLDKIIEGLKPVKNQISEAKDLQASEVKDKQGEEILHKEPISREAAHKELGIMRNNIVNQLKNKVQHKDQDSWETNLSELDEVLNDMMNPTKDYQALVKEGNRCIMALCGNAGFKEIPSSIYPKERIAEREELVKSFDKILKELLEFKKLKKVPQGSEVTWNKKLSQLMKTIDEMGKVPSDYLALANKARTDCESLYHVASPNNPPNFSKIDQILEKAVPEPIQAKKEEVVIPFEKDLATQLDLIRMEIKRLPTKKQFKRDVKVGLGILPNEYKINLKALERIIAKLNTGTATNWDSLLEQAKLKVKALYEAKGLKTPKNRFEKIDQVMSNIEKGKY